MKILTPPVLELPHDLNLPLPESGVLDYKLSITPQIGSAEHHYIFPINIECFDTAKNYFGRALYKTQVDVNLGEHITIEFYFKTVIASYDKFMSDFCDKPQFAPPSLDQLEGEDN